MISIGANLDELDLVTQADVQAHRPQHTFHRVIEHNAAILRWEHRVVKQNTHIMTFANQATHANRSA